MQRFCIEPREPRRWPTAERQLSRAASRTIFFCTVYLCLSAGVSAEHLPLVHRRRRRRLMLRPAGRPSSPPPAPCLPTALSLPALSNAGVDILSSGDTVSELFLLLSGAVEVVSPDPGATSQPSAHVAPQGDCLAQASLGDLLLISDAQGSPFQTLRCKLLCKRKWPSCQAGRGWVPPRLPPTSNCRPSSASNPAAGSAGLPIRLGRSSRAGGRCRHQRQYSCGSGGGRAEPQPAQPHQRRPQRPAAAGWGGQCAWGSGLLH